MAGEWTTRKIGTLGRVITGKTPPTADAGNFNGPYPFITIPDLDGRLVIDRSERTLSEKGAEIIRSCLLPPGAVMMSCIATVGKCGITEKPSFTNQQINSVILNDEMDPRFLYYVFTQLGHELEATGGGGSVYTNVSKSRFAEIEISIPEDLTEQRAIAYILGLLDDKIELNRRMNETLETIAQSLYKSWFVDFDPVRAKAEGRDTGLPKYVADMFPDSFEDSEMGEIPRGWMLTPLPEVIAVNPSRTLRPGELAPYLDMANMPTRGHSPDAVVQRPFRSGMRFVTGDTLVARITPCLENGKTAYVDFLQEGQVGWGSTEYIVFRPKPPLPTEYAYCLARSEEFRDFAIQSMTGSSGRQRVPAESLSHFVIASSSGKIAGLFGQLVQPLFSRARAAAEESRTLAALRDTLLPKLISGELRVKDTELIVEIV